MKGLARRFHPLMVRIVLSVSSAAAMLALTPQASFAMCVVCYNGACRFTNGKCSGFATSGGATCSDVHDARALVRPDADGEGASLVLGGEVVPAMSDRTAAILTNLMATFARTTERFRTDAKGLATLPEAKAKFQQEFAAALRSPDRKVGRERLAAFKMEVAALEKR